MSGRTQRGIITVVFLRGRLSIRTVLWLGNHYRRLLAVFLALVGPRVSYRLTELGARLLYRLLSPLRTRCEAQCSVVLGGMARNVDIPRIAERSFINRVWNLTDLMLASRWLRADTYRRYGGRVPDPFLGQLEAAQRRSQPVILLSAYYGSFDLLPVFLGYNGIRASVVYLPHGNAGFDEYRRRVRGQSGCEMVPIDNAAARLSEVLGRGGTVALIADHHSLSRGMPVTFLGQPTKASRTVGLLAWRYSADVVVAGIRRRGEGFRFHIVISDVVRHGEWAGHDDAVGFVTKRYLGALESLILDDPTQYLWGYARWGEAFARIAAANLEQERRRPPRPASAPARGVCDRQPQSN